MNQIKIKLLTLSAKLPTRSTVGSAAYDLYASEHIVIPFGDVSRVPVGFAVEVPEGFYADLRLRSGFASKNSAALCSSGVVDSDYRGEVLIPVINHGSDMIVISVGDRIGQMLILPVPETEIVQVADLSKTVRAGGGFGSTGK